MLLITQMLCIYRSQQNKYYVFHIKTLNNIHTFIKSMFVSTIYAGYFHMKFVSACPLANTHTRTSVLCKLWPTSCSLCATINNIHCDPDPHLFILLASIQHQEAFDKSSFQFIYQYYMINVLCCEIKFVIFEFCKPYFYFKPHHINEPKSQPLFWWLDFDQMSAEYEAH